MVTDKCPECGKEMFVEFENEKGIKYRCIHCRLDVVRWKND